MTTRPEGTRNGNRRELVTFIRLAPRLVGVETYTREVEWVRRERAQSEIRVKQPNGQVRVKPGLDYGSGLSVETAIDNCAVTARAYGALPGSFSPDAEIILKATLTETPFIVAADGSLEPIPDDWVVEEPSTLAAWLKACSSGRKPKATGERLGERRTPGHVVWRSQSSKDTNDGLLASFGQPGEERADEATPSFRR